MSTSGDPVGPRQGLPDTGGEEGELIGSQDRLDFIHAAAAVAAVGEQLRAEMRDVSAELVATRQYLRVVQEDRHRVLGNFSEAVQLARGIAEDVGVIREVVERLDSLVGELTEKVKAIKLPKWLGSLAQ